LRSHFRPADMMTSSHVFREFSQNTFRFKKIINSSCFPIQNRSKIVELRAAVFHCYERSFGKIHAPVPSWHQWPLQQIQEGSPSLSIFAIRGIHNPSGKSSLRPPTIDDVQYFRSVLSRPERSILTNLMETADSGDYSESGGELQRYNQDWTNIYHGSSSLVLRPQNTGEVSSILSYCRENYIGITPQGGNTGLCGGATPIKNEIILSLEDLNNIYHLDPCSGVLICDAGCILQNLHDYANEREFLLPLDIGSKGTCQIGGNISTNAGGQYFFRFGSLHGTVVGMEVVLPNGEVLHFNIDSGIDAEINAKQNNNNRSGSHRKDNTGYDLKHLFIGAEGTLGVVTKVAIACPSLPISRNSALLICNSYEKVLNVMKAAKEDLGEILSAIELMDWNTLQLVKTHGINTSDDSNGGSGLLGEILSAETYGKSNPLYLLVETQGSNLEHDNSKMDAFLTRLFESSTIDNGFLSQDSKQIMEMWKIRESCNPSVARAGCVYKFDVSVPIEEYMDVAHEVNNKLKAELNSRSEDDEITPVVCVWGHLADGNAHINIVPKLGTFDKDKSLAKLIESIVYAAVLGRKGSISAEHGLGQSKNSYLSKIKTESTLDMMYQVKKIFDPRGIMNPGKYLPRC